ncbi:activator-dependent family glycosyltransferase [Actinoplanes sp. NEAU-A12]|uniref:Activator-dependent family glycosyltransferase n=1 Tax=Actinoplanes sandaracinus TaxID=3045177 RepID=A0ABT6WZI1_9ACTN|nr:activator-dependent family glycosyltransferase [Actinoplanes sandaracinus]MDI6105167.1 activator-dependent family glycosyltransferase [Actinoplanes sandaracinus]
MRILFVANPEKSIFLYMAPLAWALRSAGHDVRFASQPGFAPVITQAGLTAVPVGRDRDAWRMARMMPGAVEESRADLPLPWSCVSDPANATWEQMFHSQVAAAETAQSQNFPIIADLVEFARAWGPDLVVWEPMTYAGAIAAKACGAAHARLLFGVDVFGQTRALFHRLSDAQPAEHRGDPLADWLAPYGRRYGFDVTEDLTVGHFTIDQFPASLQDEAAGLQYVRTQYIPYGGPAVVPRWLWAKPEKPRVGLTMGLTATEVYDGYTISMAEVLESLADLDIEIVATVAEAEQAKLPPLPDNVRLVSYVPWHALAPTCAAVIHHAGAATIGTTSRHAVPQLALHYHFDQPILGRKLAEHGAGLELHTSVATGAAVRAAVLRLLTEPSFRRRAADLTAEIHAAPSPNRLVPQLEELTTKYRS